VVLQKEPKNALALNNLAWTLRESDTDKALSYAERAAEIAPESPDVLDTLAVVLLQKGDYPKAERTIDRALTKAPQNGTLRYHRALIAQAQGRTDEARRMLVELTAAGAKFPERAEAEALLGRLKQ